MQLTFDIFKLHLRKRATSPPLPLQTYFAAHPTPAPSRQSEGHRLTRGRPPSSSLCSVRDRSSSCQLLRDGGIHPSVIADRRCRITGHVVPGLSDDLLALFGENSSNLIEASRNETKASELLSMQQIFKLKVQARHAPLHLILRLRLLH